MASLRNVSRFDATVRILLGVCLLGYAAQHGNRPFLAIAWGAVGLLVLGTGCLRVCPLYTLIHALRHPAAGRP